MNAHSDSTIPSRADVEQRWSLLADGRLSREDAHAWAVQWVEDRDSEIEDPMVRNGLQHLHGFDLMSDPETPNLVMHAQGASYVHSHQEIVEQLMRWRANCALYDADPESYARSVRDRAIEEMRRSRRGDLHEDSM